MQMTNNEKRLRTYQKQAGYLLGQYDMLQQMHDDGQLLDNVKQHRSERSELDLWADYDISILDDHDKIARLVKLTNQYYHRYIRRT